MFTIEELATIPLLSTLGEKELEYLAGTVEDVAASVGEGGMAIAHVHRYLQLTP